MVSNMEMEQTKQMVGQHFVAGFAGLKLSEEFVRLIKEYKIGNVILFRQNGKSKEHRPNPIIQMGLFTDGDGIPLAFSLFPGQGRSGAVLPAALPSPHFPVPFPPPLPLCGPGLPSDLF